jgi:hypothetical protein
MGDYSGYALNFYGLDPYGMSAYTGGIPSLADPQMGYGGGWGINNFSNFYSDSSQPLGGYGGVGQQGGFNGGMYFGLPSLMSQYGTPQTGQ